MGTAGFENFFGESIEAEVTLDGMLFFGVFLVINMSADIERGSFVVRQWERLHPIGHRTLTVTIRENRFASGSYVGTSELN